MPDRIIRDELLRSRRYRTLSSDTARLLFFHLLLSIDNLGNHEADDIAIGDVMRRPLDPATTAKLLSELADVDLIRLYAVDGKQYLHVPRFRQRLRYLGAKHPRPQPEIECKEISELCEEYGLKPGEVPDKAVRKLREEKRSEEKRSEEKRSRSTPARADGSVDNSAVATKYQAPQIKTVLEKLTSKANQPAHRTRQEQLAYIAAAIAKKQP